MLEHVDAAAGLAALQSIFSIGSLKPWPSRTELTPPPQVSVMEDEGTLADHLSGVSATDGQWHHVAVTWESRTGNAILYLDSREVWRVTRGKGKRIPSGGTLVVGREQVRQALGTDRACSCQLRKHMVLLLAVVTRSAETEIDLFLYTIMGTFSSSFCRLRQATQVQTGSARSGVRSQHELYPLVLAHGACSQCAAAAVRVVSCRIARVAALTLLRVLLVVCQLWVTRSMDLR